ncbi:glycine/sarcosine/betaine reductase component B subunit [Tepidimicrobium xylanilyticum]|uniref:glycine/sarcosine/betaine reductase component B subunit n=1 Tax=Tepidimicrobium xylanilyticum TaxID=1123352 RepID=UPI0026538240|nr:glycine/sarcosine/betaine reductase component B subunit [Tepidimicrobium xylanilyticum]GMG95460.1 glycine reductase complex proprotein GrdE1 [Tepidimicrobium xylanilyticum]
MKLKRQYFDVKDVIFSDKTQYKDGVLSINEEELLEKIRPLMKSVTDVDFELVKPGESARIVHVLDTIQPMYKVEGIGKQYSGFFGHPNVVGEGITNLLRGFTVMESAPLPWDESSASSGLLYPRDAIIDMIGPIAGFTPFSQTINLVITYKLLEGKSSAEYDNDIRLCGLKVSEILAELTVGQVPNEVEEFSISNINPELPNVVLVWQCQNQGVYSNTYLYAHDISNLVPTLLHPNEMLDGCIVSGNYVWPAFKVPTYLHVNHPILLELYRLHNKELNFRGVILSRSHNPTNWHKERSANFCVKLAKYLGADGLIMAWEGGGNAAVDGMLTIQAAEKNGIKASTITFEFGGVDGTEGILLVDDVPEADAIISGGSIEKPYTLPKVERVVGGEVLRLNKESGGYFPPANKSITFDTTTHFYCSGNQSGHGKLFAEAY